MKFCYLALSISLLAVIVGCSEGSASVKGRVTFNGDAVDPGSIEFLPEEGTAGVKLAAPIEAGKYEIPRDRGAVTGTYRVEIHWSKKTGKQVPSADPGMPPLDEMAEAIPAEFNTNSTLRRDLKTGENTLDFELSSP